MSITSISYRSLRWLSQNRLRFSIDLTDRGVCPVTYSRKMYFCGAPLSPFLAALPPLLFTLHLLSPANSSPPAHACGPIDRRLSFVSARGIFAAASGGLGSWRSGQVVPSCLNRTPAPCVCLSEGLCKNF